MAGYLFEVPPSLSCSVVCRGLYALRGKNVDRCSVVVPQFVVQNMKPLIGRAFVLELSYLSCVGIPFG
jgi:hypothetical protein